MGVAGTVMSPTFVIARVHAGDPPLVHVDAYRLTGTVELDDLDLDTDLGRSAVVVEWGEGVAEQLTDQRLIVALERLPDDTRIARLTPVGTDWVDRLHALIDTIDDRRLRRPRRPRQLAAASPGAPLPARINIAGAAHHGRLWDGCDRSRPLHPRDPGPGRRATAARRPGFVPAGQWVRADRPAVLCEHIGIRGQHRASTCTSPR